MQETLDQGRLVSHGLKFATQGCGSIWILLMFAKRDVSEGQVLRWQCYNHLFCLVKSRPLVSGVVPVSWLRTSLEHAVMAVL